jgi:hypothetical protein
MTPFSGVLCALAAVAVLPALQVLRELDEAFGEEYEATG